MTTAPRPDSTRHIDHAQWYADVMRWAVFPVHVPLFDHETGYTCSCEFYRHSEKCKHEHAHIYMQPDEHCQQPGKCPAVKWAAKATTDADQIHKWWDRPWKMVDDRTGKAYRFEMNIGRDNGKSGILTLDADEYKDTYGGAGLLSRADQETVTAITGGGGTHLDYLMPEGKAYGNKTGNLPPGIDIRGVGGYTVLTPSLHKSGNRYQYEGAYGPDEIDLLPMPTWLCEALETAYSQRSGESGQGVGPSDVEAVQRSTDVVEALIAHAELTHGGAQSWNGDGRKYVLHDCPYSEDHRDGSFIVIHQDGTIGAGCHHSRCQHRIKESGGSGWQLLKEIAGFQPDGSAWVVDPDEVRAEVAQLREWATSTNFSSVVPDELINGNRYMTDGVDHKVYDAVLDLAELHGTRRVYVSRRALALRAGVGSHTTAQRALDRLRSILTVEDDGCIVVMSIHHEPLGSSVDTERLMAHGGSTYTERKADDPFLTGVSKTAKSLGNEERGLGETILRIIDALEKCGAMTRAELVDAAGKTKAAVGRATLRAERDLGLLCAYQEHKKAPKVYSLNPDWRESVDNLTPLLKTYKLSAERGLKHYSGVIADRVERGKTARESDAAALVAALVSLYGYSEGEAQRRVDDYARTLDRLCMTTKTDDKHRRSGHLEVQRMKRHERMMSAFCVLSSPGAVWGAVDTAMVRQAAGRLNRDVVTESDKTTEQLHREYMLDNSPFKFNRPAMAAD